MIAHRARLAGALLIVTLTACSTSTSAHPAENHSKAGTDTASTGMTTATSAPTTASTLSGASAGPDGMAHPCSLLTQSEAAALAGTPLEAGVEAGQGENKTLCQYVGPSTGPLAQVQIFVGDSAKKVLDIDRDVLKNSFTALTNIGDEAYQEGDTVFVRKGVTWVSISLTRLNNAADNSTRIQAAALQVAHRMV